MVLCPNSTNSFKTETPDFTPSPVLDQEVMGPQNSAGGSEGSGAGSVRKSRGKHGLRQGPAKLRGVLLKLSAAKFSKTWVKTCGPLMGVIPWTTALIMIKARERVRDACRLSGAPFEGTLIKATTLGS